MKKNVIYGENVIYADSHAPQKRCGPSLRLRNNLLRFGVRNVIYASNVIYALPQAQRHSGLLLTLASAPE